MNFVCRSFIIQFKTAIIYKVSTISSLLGQSIQMILLFFFWTKVYNPDLYTLQYVIYSRVLFCFIEGNCVWDIADEIKNGNVAIKLAKPLDYFQYNYIMHLSKMVGVFILHCIPLLIAAFILVPINVSIIQLILCGLSLVLSITISYCFDFVISLLCVFTHNTWGISALRDGLVQILSGAIVPIYMFPKWAQNIIYIFPFAYMIDSPVKILIEQDLSCKVFAIQVLYSCIMFIFAINLNKLVMKKNQIQGG